MNYIQEINAFYDWLETNPLSGNAINLWHALMATANKAGWINKFAVAISILEAKSGLNKKAVERARNELSQKGRIIWKSRSGNKSAEYSIISLCDKKGTKNVPQDVPQDGAQDVPQGVPQCGAINKLNETKLNETSLPVSPVGEAEVSASKIKDLYNEICKNLPKASSITEKRRKSINARLREHGYEKVIQMLKIASKSNFLAGENNRGWIADIDWLFRPERFVNILEGKYDDRNKPGFQGTVTNGKDSNFSYLEGAFERLTQQS